jgi:hypothetical protein
VQQDAAGGATPSHSPTVISTSEIHALCKAEETKKMVPHVALGCAHASFHMVALAGVDI